MQGHFLPSSLLGNATGVAIGGSSLAPCLSGTSIMVVIIWVRRGPNLWVAVCRGVRRGVSEHVEAFALGSGVRHVHVGINIFALGQTCSYWAQRVRIGSEVRRHCAVHRCTSWRWCVLACCQH